jgi:hypothetical protein
MFFSAGIFVRVQVFNLGAIAAVSKIIVVI